MRRTIDAAADTPADLRSSSRRDPLSELEQLNRRLAGYLDSWRQAPSLLAGLFTPPADIEETDDAYLVDIELPGVRKQDLNIEIAGRRLTVHGDRKEKQHVGILRRRERAVGRFHYEVILPGNVDDDGIVANVADGVLTVRVPKPESKRHRRIAVH
jgi:HSP20 family protein